MSILNLRFELNCYFSLFFCWQSLKVYPRCISLGKLKREKRFCIRKCGVVDIKRRLRIYWLKSRSGSACFFGLKSTCLNKTRTDDGYPISAILLSRKGHNGSCVTIRSHLQSSVSMDVTSPSSISGNSYPFLNFLKETHPRLTIHAIQGCLKFSFSKILLQLIVIKTLYRNNGIQTNRNYKTSLNVVINNLCQLQSLALWKFTIFKNNWFIFFFLYKISVFFVSICTICWTRVKRGTSHEPNLMLLSKSCCCRTLPFGSAQTRRGSLRRHETLLPRRVAWRFREPTRLSSLAGV